MKKNILLILFPIIFIQCEDVVEIKTPDEEPRLIIDAVIRVNEEQPLINLMVKVTETNSFFGEIPVTNLKQITISNNTGDYVVLLEEDPGSGVYKKESTLNFLSSGELILQIEHKDQRYLARTEYISTVPIDTLYQGTETLFNESDTELIITFTDNPDRNDYYLFDLDFSEFTTTYDQFYQGKEFTFSYFYEKELQPGQNINVSIMGVDYSFYNYMNQIIEQSSQNDFGPFQTPVATVRGNIINVTEIDNIDYFDNVDQANNFALGYFAVVQTYSKSILLK